MTNQSADHIERAIKEVIARETDAFVDHDFDGWAACWVQDHRTREVCMSSPLGATVLEGWDHLARNMRAVFDSGSGCQIVEFLRTNWNITISGTLAYAVFDGTSNHIGGRIERTFETRVLEQQNDVWRILYSSFVLHGHQSVDSNRLAVDAHGNILCAPDIALDLIKSHDGLQISQGRLRANTPAWDRKLQSGLKSAAAHHGYFQHYRYLAQNGKNFRLPVVLGETDDGGISVCVLFVRDGMTFVEVQAEAEVEARMMVAKTIFGLSDGQMRLASRIVSGDGLTTAAETMGISINTARTHLSRIYAKTGIHSQTALVRTLLSVG